MCQLERIQARVDSVFPDGPHPVRFWMDTLCIPAAKEYKALRNKSIALMQQIYKLAFAVLVFDAGLQQLSRSSTPHEKAISLYMSNWVHRLWTFQEGMFAKKLFFQLKDGVEDITADEEHDADQEDEGSGLFPRSALVAITGHFVILKDFVEMKATDPSVGNWLLLPPLAHALHQRTTTRMSDEAICAATILDLDVNEIMGVPDPDGRKKPEEILAVERMEIFLRQMRHFRPGIVFHNQKRMKKEGYRWAPATMMGVEPGIFSREMESGASSFRGKGLRVRYPGFILETVRAGSAVEIMVMVKQYSRQFRLQIFPEDGEAVVWDPNSMYAVVTFRPVPWQDDTGTEAVVGILKNAAPVRDEQVKKRRSRNVLHLDLDLRCEWRAWVEPLKAHTMDVAVVADVLGETQKWCLL